MTDPNDQRLTPYTFLRVFADDGTIDAAELAMLEQLALEDCKIDDQEREILTSIFARVSPDRVDPDTWMEIQAFKDRAGIP